MGMTREEIIETMIDTVNVYNVDWMMKSGMSDEEIEKNIEGQRPALDHMFDLIYRSLENKGAFTQN
jgi:hypothetical protein